MPYIASRRNPLSPGRLMGGILRFGIVLLVLAAGGANLLAPQETRSAEPELVARVNGVAVTRGELRRVLDDPLALNSLRQELGANSGKQDLDRLAVRKLIHRLLFLQEAERLGFTITDAELDHSLSALRKRFGDLTEFSAWMHNRGLDDRSLLDTLREQILMTRTWTALAAGAKVSEAEINAFYENNKNDLVVGEEVRLRIIAVREEKAAEEILHELKKGGNFITLAKEKSVGIRAARGGDTGWINYQTLAPELRQAVGRLQAGDVAGPVQKSPDEYLLVGLEGRRPLSARSLEQAKPEIERRLLAEERQKIVKAWLEEQEKQSTIEILLNGI